MLQKKNGLRTVNGDPIFIGRRYRRSVLRHHSSASRFTVGAAEQRDEREHIQPQREARYEADVWEDKIHDIWIGAE